MQRILSVLLRHHSLRISRGLILQMALACLSSVTLAQYGGTGMDDPSWTIPTTTFSTDNQTLWTDIEALPDGKLLATGRFWQSPGGNRPAVFRFDRNGRPDAGFGSNGVVTVPVPANFTLLALSRIGVDALGRIYLAGFYRTEQPPRVRHEGQAVIRLHADGTLDSTYGTGGIAQVLINTHSVSGGGTWFEQRFISLPLSIKGIALQPDGELLLLSNGLDIRGDFPALVLLLRLDANGQWDSSFGEAGAALVPLSRRGSADAVAVKSDGTIVITGSDNYTFEQGIQPGYRTFVIQLTAQGTLDTSFAEDGRMHTPSSYSGHDLAIQPDEKIVVGGRRCASGVFDCEIMVFRLDSDGELDTGFGTDGYSYVDPTANSEGVRGLKLGTYGNIFLAGEIYTPRANGDGAYEPGYKPFFASLSPAGELDYIRTDITNPESNHAESLVVGNKGAFLLTVGSVVSPPARYSIRKFVVDRVPPPCWFMTATALQHVPAQCAHPE